MKKWLAWILTLAMIIGVLPVNTLNVSAETTDHNVETQAGEDEYGVMPLSGDTAVARIQTNGQSTYYQTLEAAFTAIGQNGSATIELLRDVRESELFVSGDKNFSVGVVRDATAANKGYNNVGNIVITGGESGKKIIGEDLNAPSHFMNNYAQNLTLQNLTFEGFDRGGFLWNMRSNVTITFDNVIIKNCNFSDAVIDNSNNPHTLKLSNSQIIGNTRKSVNLVSSNVTIELSGNTIIKDNVDKLGASLNLDGEDVTKLKIADDFTGEVHISNMVSAGQQFATVINVYETGGKFVNAADSTKYVVKDGTALKWSDGAPFAQIEGVDTKYSTFKDAYDQATAGATIKILRDGTDRDFDKNNKGNVTLNKNITIDGNNHTITGSSKEAGHQFNIGATVTIKNLTFQGLSRAGFIWFTGTSTLTLDNVKVSNNTFGEHAIIGEDNINNKVTLTLKDTTIKDNVGATCVTGHIESGKNAVSTILSGTTVVTGNVNTSGTAVGINANVGTNVNKIVVKKDFNGKVEISGLTSDNDVFATADESYALQRFAFVNTSNINKDVVRDENSLKWSGTTAVAMVDTTPYQDVATAVSEATEGSTVTILRDMTIAEFLGSSTQIALDKNLTIDGNGHVITHADSNINDHVFKANGENPQITIKNLTFNGLLQKNGLIYIDTDSSTITLQDVTVENFTLYAEGGRMIGHHEDAKSANIILENTKIRNNQTFSVISNSADSTGSVNVTLKGTTEISGNKNQNGEVANVVLKTVDNLTVEEGFTGKVGVKCVGNDNQSADSKFGKTGSNFTNVEGIVNDGDDSLEVNVVTEDGNSYLKWKSKQMVAALYTGKTKGTEYATLAAAIKAYTNTNDDQFIQMIADTTEADITLDKTIYLDLAGHTVNANITATGENKLFGIDSKTNTYMESTDKPAGKIVGTVNGAGSITNASKARIGERAMRYLKVTNSDGSIGFHRFKIALYSVNFKLKSSTAQAIMEYKCYLQGDKTILELANGLGFTAYESESITPTYNEEFSAMVAEKINAGGTGNAPVFFTATIIDSTSGTITAANYGKTFHVMSAVMFSNGVEATSNENSTSFLRVVCDTYKKDTTTEIDKNRIDAFIAKVGNEAITSQWNSMKGQTTV